MKRTFSSRLSPQAKKAALRSTPEAWASVLVQVAPQSNAEDLQHELEDLGARALRWMEETKLLAAELPAASLEAVAELPSVVYVELATKHGV